MDQRQAIALAMYINRAMPIIPTTGAEWSVISGVLAMVESVANGLVTVEVKAVGGLPTKEPEAAAEVNPESHEG